MDIPFLVNNYKDKNIEHVIIDLEIPADILSRYDILLASQVIYPADVYSIVYSFILLKDKNKTIDIYNLHYMYFRYIIYNGCDIIDKTTINYTIKLVSISSLLYYTNVNSFGFFNYNVTEDFKDKIKIILSYFTQLQLESIKGNKINIIDVLDEENRSSQHSKVVCAAIKLESGTIILGARHFDKYMHENIKDRELENEKVIEQGFIDSKGNFLSRKEAYIVAKENNQIRYIIDNYDELFSENLY